MTLTEAMAYAKEGYGIRRNGPTIGAFSFIAIWTPPKHVPETSPVIVKTDGYYDSLEKRPFYTHHALEEIDIEDAVAQDWEAFDEDGVVLEAPCSK